MPYDINKSLERLEQSLKEIESAKQQVEQTVDASNELQGVVAKYISSLDTLLKGVQDWIKEISSLQSSNITDFEKSIEKVRKSCDNIIDNFTASTNKLSDNLKEKTGEELVKLENSNTKLSSQVDKLAKLDEDLKAATSAIDTIKEKLGEVLKELQESQGSQDNTLDEIRKGQDGLCKKNDNIKTLCNGIVKSLDTISDAIDGIDNLVSNTRNDISGLKKDCDNYVEQLKSEISDLDQKVSALNNRLETTSKELMKYSNTNRWILIVGVLILAVLLFVLK